ncbi:MAG: DUF4043 family protein [Oxalobacteraceae bacterium]|jgi:hypothetical protein|nr:DUF4043 family protein [Oxalobacteraceae bacterium]
MRNASRPRNPNFLLPLGYAGRANNGLVSPDAQHALYVGDATSFANLDAADTFDLRLIDRAMTKADRLIAKPLSEACLVLDENVKLTAKDARDSASAMDRLRNDFFKAILDAIFV